MATGAGQYVCVIDERAAGFKLGRLLFNEPGFVSAGTISGQPGLAAALQNKVQRVDDVHQFPGHIACDSASNAEIVIPIHKNGKLVGVLDLDSPLKNRFTEEDEAGLKKIVAALEEIAEFTD